MNPCLVRLARVVSTLDSLVSCGGWICQVRLHSSLLVNCGGEVFWSLMNDFVTSAGSPPSPLSCLPARSSYSFFFLFPATSPSSLSQCLTSAHLSLVRSPLVPPTHPSSPFFIHHFMHHLNLCVCPLILSHF